jgi:hypothetical protein
MNIEEHIETPHAIVRKHSGNRKKSNVIFLALPAVLTIFFPLGGLPYLCGRFIPYTVALLHICMLYPLMFIFIIYCLRRGFLRRFRCSRESNAQSRLTNAVEIGIPLVFIISFIISFFISVKGMTVLDKPFMYGLRTRMKSKADVEAIRVWLESLDDEEYKSIDNSYNDFSHKRSEWPEPLRALKPGKVFLSADENGNAKVRLMWGSGPIEGHWGVEIGAESMKFRRRISECTENIDYP